MTGVDSFVSVITRACEALLGAEADVAEGTIRSDAPGGTKTDTFLLVIFAPSLSSAALSRACNSWRIFTPLVFTARLLLIAAERAGDRAIWPERDLSIAGDAGATAAMRLREVAERETAAVAEGEAGMTAVRRLAAGESVGIEEAVLLRGIPMRVRFRSSGVPKNEVRGGESGEGRGGTSAKHIS